MNFKTFIHRIPVVLQHGQGISCREIWMDLLQNSAPEKWRAGATDRLPLAGRIQCSKTFLYIYKPLSFKMLSLENKYIFSLFKNFWNLQRTQWSRKVNFNKQIFLNGNFWFFVASDTKLAFLNLEMFRKIRWQ